MNFNGKATLVFLEEDNITKAYFRIKPLLAQDGPVSDEVLASLPDEGFLRIVPDRNEQHTFKERMRSMCGLCMLDLRNQPAEANKIRTNKNYSPSNGENNQYIVYSDAVCAIAPDVFFQVVSENEIEKAVTPYVYVRNGANMQGPFKKNDVISLENAKQLPPDSQGLHSVSVQGQELLFFWPVDAAEKAESKPETPTNDQPAEKSAEPVSALDQIQEINSKIVDHTSNRLTNASAPAAFVPQQPQQPLNGTKLYSAGQKGNNYRRVHNPLIEAVEMQRYAAKQEAPGAVVQDCAALRDVENPVDSFKVCLQKVCLNAEDSRQAVDIILSCPGMQNALFSATAGAGKPFSASAMNHQLQELEAERLMLLMQLDDAKKDMTALKNSALEEAVSSEKKAIEQLADQKKLLSEEIKQQNNALLALNTKRAEAEETLQKAMNMNASDALVRPVGEILDAHALTSRVQKAYQAAGFTCSEDDAYALLTAYALSRHCLIFNASSNADAYEAAKIFASVFHAPTALYGNEGNIWVAPGGNTPAFIRAQLQADATAVLLPGDIKKGITFHMDMPCAMLPIAADMNAIPNALPVNTPVSLASLDGFIQSGTPDESALAAIRALRSVNPAYPLPVSCVSNAVRFIVSTQNHLKGGVAEAIDRAVSMFILPYYLSSGLNKDELTAYLNGLPRSMTLWDENK